MEKSLRENTRNNNEYKILKLAMGIFLLSPLAFMIYISYSTNGDIAGALAKDTMLNVTFIAAMISGFSALICKGIFKDLKARNAVETAKIQLILMLIAQVLLFNFIGIVLITAILITSFDWKKNSIKGLFKKFKKEKLYSKLIGSSMVLALALLCLVITIRIS